MGRNECAQRAAAALLARHHGGDAAAWHARVARTHPPDSPLRLWGTTPRQLAAALTAHGLPADVTRRHLTSPGIACVDLRPLVGGPPRLHWLVVERVTEASVETSLPRLLAPREEFERAWSCRVSPFRMHRQALVSPVGASNVPA